MAKQKNKLLISVVSPVYNNARHLAGLVHEISEALHGQRCEVILVDDGSPDNSWQVVTELAKAAKRQCIVRGVRLSRNFGQHAAIFAGLNQARGDYIFVLDADLQDNPAFMGAMFEKALKGFDIVHARRTRQRLTFKRLLTKVVYRLLTTASEIRLHATMGNFKLLSRRALETALRFAGPQPLFELMVDRAGYPAAFVDVERRNRPLDVSAYNLRDSLRFIGNLLVAYSSLAFRFFLLTGLVLAPLGLLGLGLAWYWSAVPLLVVAAAAFNAGLILICAATVGFYVRTQQVSGRGAPAFVIQDQV